MRYFLLLFFSLFTTFTVAQTYTVVIDGRLPPAPGTSDAFSTVTGGNVNFSFDIGNPSGIVQFYEELPNKSFTSLRLRTFYFPVPSGCTPPNPDFSDFLTNELIPTPTGGGGGRDYCSAFFSVDAVPEMTITGPSGDICAGRTIDLVNSENFPDEAYTWNFRIFNPAGDPVSGGGLIPSTFYTLNPTGPGGSASFNMIDLLGAEVANNVGNTVEFYMGAQSFVFSNSVSIVIDNCTPFLDEQYPENTSCSDSTDGSVEVALLSGLDPSENEYLVVTVNTVTPEGFTIPEYNVDIFSLTATSNGANTFTLPNLVAGTYEIDYQSWIDPDGTGGDPAYPNGLGIPFTFDISRPSSVVIDNVVLLDNPDCPGEFGVRRIEVSGGQDFQTGVYHFTKDGGGNWNIPTDPNAVDYTYSDLVPGSDYTFGVKLVFTDGSGECESADSTDQSIPAIIDPIMLAGGSGISNQPSNASATDGIIFAQVTGGTSAFTFEIYSVLDPNNPISSITQTSRVHQFTMLGVGLYFLKIRDNSGCEVENESTPFELAAAPLPTLGSPTTMSPTCNGGNDGSAMVGVTYPTATTFSYELRDGITVVQDGTTTTNTISIGALSEGNYFLYVISALGDFSISETVVISNEIIIIAPAEVTIDSFTPNDISCFGETDGSISITPLGGTNYEYTLELVPDPADWAPLIGNTIENLSAGFYYLTIRNENGCQSATIDNTNILIREPDVVDAVVTSTPATTVGGFEGSTSLAISGGTPRTAPLDEYSITWTKQTDGPEVAFIDTDTSTPYEITGLEAGTYRPTITDVNTCTTDPASPIEIIIIEPGELEIQSFTGTNVTCNGEDDGMLTATVQGTLEVTYRLILEDGSPSGTVVATEVNSANAATFAGVSPGTYRLSVQDSGIGPLLSTNTVIVEEPPVITATIVPTPTCFNGDTGTITISGAMGGTLDPISNYSYSIDGGMTFQNTGIFEDLALDSYDVVIEEDGGCRLTQTIAIIETDPITLNTATSVVNNISTAGLMDGSISPVFDGGFDDGIGEPFEYFWTGPNVGGITNQNVSGLSQGTYNVRVTDDNGCIINQEFIISEPGALAINITNQQNPCFGETNGSISASVLGTGPYVLQWSEQTVGDLAGETGLNLENIGPGTYTLNVVDNGTTPATTGSSLEVILIEPAQISADTDTTPSCQGNADGTIILSNVMGGEPGNLQDYTYSINGIDFQNELTIEGLAPQPYSVWIRDGNGCDRIYSGIVVDTAPPIEWDELNTIATNVTAMGASDGTITLAFTSISTNYTYEWNGPGTVDEATQNLTGKAAGVYTLIVTDENDCTLERIFTIAEPGILTITINDTKNPCFGENNGNIQTTVIGTGNLSYQWSEAILGDLVGETGPNLNNAVAGTYTLTVSDDATDPANTLSSNPITLSDPQFVLAAQPVPTDAQCAGVSDGMVLINATGGTAPYEYSIDAGITYQTANTFTDLVLGSYTIRVRDSNDCITDVPTTINEPTPITLTFLATPVSGAGAADGSIDIAASGGTGNLSFSWTGPAGFTPSTSEDISGLVEGDYVVTVEDENGCVFPSDPIRITEPGAIIILLDQNEEISCNGDPFGEIIADVQGGVPDYTYQWFEDGNNAPLDETTNILSGLNAGTYFLRITDANDVSQDSNLLTLTEPDALEVTLQNKVDVVCSGEATGSINIAIQGGTPPYRFEWNNVLSSQNLTDIEAGDYSLEVFDFNGCSAELNVTINAAPDAIQISDATITNISEYLANDGIITLDITGGATPYTINWTRESDASPAGNSATITNLSADSYTVSVTDANGCNINETYEITQPDIVEETVVQPSCQGDSNGSISVLVNQGNGTFTYLWNTGETTNAITNLGAGDYSITVTGFGDGPLTRTYTLVDPLPLEVDLGQDRVLCVDQEVTLDASVKDDTATYSWTADNGFTNSNPEVTLTETGNYTVTVQTASGCIAVGTIFVDISDDEIDAEFAVSSQVFTGETLVAVDISFPLPETIEWVIPDGARIIKEDSDEVELIFDVAGEYEIGIITTRGDCVAQKTKKVLVVQKDASITEDNEASKLVEDFIIYPNPTTGRFTADVSLSERGNISIKVFNFANNALTASERGRNATNYSIPFDISGMPSGVYAVLLETPYGNSLRKIIVR